MDTRKVTREALTHLYTRISETVSPKNLIQPLFTQGVISLEEKQKLERESINHGEISQARKLLDFLLDKSDDDLEVFLDLLKIKEVKVHTALSDVIGDIQSGVIPIRKQLDIQGIEETLRKNYLKNKKWATVEPIPDDLCIDITNDALYMTPIFSAEQIRPDNSIPSGFLPAKPHPSNVAYDKLTVPEFEQLFEQIEQENVEPESFGNVKNKTNHKLIVCTGDPGVGKTTLLHKTAIRWAEGASSLSKYKAIFLLPVRDISSGKSICEFLQSMDLLPHDCTDQMFSDFLTSQGGKEVLFLFDGIDENELSEEALQLIQGVLYRKCSVLLTSRPESEALKSLSVHPQIKVLLHGTDEESVNRFISGALGKTSEAKGFYTTCRNTLTNMKMLFIPLYLTLMACVLKDAMAQGISVTNFKVPQTATEIFNSFLIVLVKRWLKRIGRFSELHVKYSRKPLGKDSTIPRDIQRIIYFIGKMCYKGLCVNQYEFSAEDVHSDCLDLQEVEHSGLFSKGYSKGVNVYSLKHKQMQEFFAAVYLVENKEIQLLLAPQSENTRNFVDDSRPVTLAEYCTQKNVVKTIQFLVGLSPDALCNILASTRHSGCIKKSPVDGSVDIYYESSLFNEANTLNVLNDVAEYLLSSNLVEFESGFKNYLETSCLNTAMTDQFEIGHYESYQMTLKKMLILLSCSTSSKLLLKWYDIKLNPLADSTYQLEQRKDGSKSLFQRIQMTFEKHESVEQNVLYVCLDQVSSLLLPKFVITEVTELCVRSYHSVFVNFNQLSKCLKHGEHLDILGRTIFSVPDEDDRKMDDRKSELDVYQPRKVHSISLTSHGSSVLSQDNVNFILSQQDLQSLTLIRADMFHGVAPQICPMFHKLEEVILSDHHFTAAKMRGLCCLLKSAINIRSLRLWFTFKDNQLDMSELTKYLKNASLQLEKLFMSLEPLHYMKEVTCSVLPEMQQLRHFGGHCNQIKSIPHELISALCSNKSVRVFTLCDYDSHGICTQYQFPNDCLLQLKKRKIELKVRTPKRLVNMEDYLKLFKQW